ncbi:hypothetical protein HanIR_Chr09g0431931 [Helianthus annuus]|nr:hypothetical protein HanIR_Chr09g0431931 [Helianthus annuus]
MSSLRFPRELQISQNANLEQYLKDTRKVVLFEWMASLRGFLQSRLLPQYQPDVTACSLSLSTQCRILYDVHLCWSSRPH